MSTIKPMDDAPMDRQDTGPSDVWFVNWFVNMSKSEDAPVADPSLDNAIRQRRVIQAAVQDLDNNQPFRAYAALTAELRRK